MKDKFVPEIRFIGFDETWQKRRLGEVSPLRGGYAFKSSAFRQKGIPIIRISNILSTENVGGEYVYYDEQPNDGKYTLPNASVLLAMSGATTGKVSILKIGENKKMYQNQRVGYFTNLGIIDYNFVSVITRSQLFNNQLKSVLVAGAQPNISSTQIDNFEFYFPMDKEEQQKIGDFFKQLDERIELCEKELTNIKQTKQGFLQKMFPKEGSSVPELRFPGYIGDWKQYKLGELCNIVTGKLDANAMKENGKYDFYTSGVQKYKIDIPAFEGPAITIAGNGATVGYMHYADGKFNAYQRTYVLSKFKANREFLFSSIGNNLPKKIQQEARTGSIPYIVMDMISELPLLLPQLEEQEKIGTFFRQLDELVTLHEQELKNLKQTKQAFLQKMFI